MNVEAFFVKTSDLERLMAIVLRRLESPPDPPGAQPVWGMPSSYDALLAADRKRKIALSQPIDGWVEGVESKEVLDFELLQRISAELETAVVAIQLSEVSGCCGYALCRGGQLADHLFSEQSDDPSGEVHAYLAGHRIPLRLVSFREAVQLRQRGWILIG